MLEKTILIVDDTVTNLDILSDLLCEYAVIKATNGQDALEIVAEDGIDLILLDIMMPEMDGYEVCEKLKSNPKTKNIPIIFITAKTDEASIVKAYDIGGADYVTKPFLQKELLAKIHTQFALMNKTYNLQKLVTKQLEELRRKDVLLIEQSKKAEMGELISKIAHQLKQPLNLISANMINITFFEMLGKEINIKKLSEDIQKEVDFMSKTINMYQTFFKDNQQKNSMMLNDIIEDALYILTIEKSDTKILKEYDETLTTIDVFSNEIIQCIMNIIKNAQDNQKEKEITNKLIKLSTFQEDEYQVITIHDNSGGVPEAIKEKIFENYFTTKSEEKGTGIGLYLVKQIIEDKHNGEVFVKNDKFQYNHEEYFGAKFFIKLSTNANIKR